MTHHYQHILVAVDFSEMAELVLTQAKFMADLYQAQLTVLHIVQEVVPGMEVFGDTSGLIANTEMEQEMLAIAKERIPALVQQHGIDPAHVQIETGVDVTDTILDVAKNTASDLIVIGHSGKKGFLGLMGSNATSVVKSAQCDVLVIRR